MKASPAARTSSARLPSRTVDTGLLPIGVGLGWRPQTAFLVERRAGLAFTEVVVETLATGWRDRCEVPPALAHAVDRGLPVVAHGVGLDLGGANGLERARVRRLANAARALRSPVVSEHVAFCRAGSRESAHFLPVPRTRAQLALLIDHVRRVQDALPVPFALENVAAPIAWPDDELAEADFLAELLDRTGARLLLDASNLHANLVNHGGDLDRYLSRLPLDRIAYLHVAGGARIDATAMWRDTHAHPIAPAVHDTLSRILARTGPVPLLLERDHHHELGLADELDLLDAVLAASSQRTWGDLPGREVPGGLQLPEVDRALRRHLANRQSTLLALLADADDDAKRADELVRSRGFDPRHLAETRAIVGGKQAIRDRRSKDSRATLGARHHRLER